VLIDMSGEVDVLVLGHRGRGGFASMLLGSVSLQCVLHARCPVIVVRPTAVEESASTAGSAS
jgi:nucleotide-binding universal stress UspA family protein